MLNVFKIYLSLVPEAKNKNKKKLVQSMTRKWQKQE